MADLSRPTDAKREGLHRARKLREELRKRGEFTQKEFREQLGVRLDGLKAAAFEALVDHIAERVDEESTRDREAGAQTLLPFDLDGEYKFDDGKRIAKRKARKDHAEKALALKRKNLEKVRAAYKRDKNELAQLRKVWKAGMTKEDAVKEWQKANPSSQEEVA